MAGISGMTDSSFEYLSIYPSGSVIKLKYHIHENIDSSLFTEYQGSKFKN